MLYYKNILSVFLFNYILAIRVKLIWSPQIVWKHVWNKLKDIISTIIQTKMGGKFIISILSNQVEIIFGLSIGPFDWKKYLGALSMICETSI